MLLGLTWAGLAPADRASFAWRLPSLHCAVGWAKAHERSINTLELACAFAHAARHVSRPPRGQNLSPSPTGDRSKAERTLQHRAGDFAPPTRACISSGDHDQSVQAWISTEMDLADIMSLGSTIFLGFRLQKPARFVCMHVGALIALLRGVTLPFLASISAVFEFGWQDDSGQGWLSEHQYA